MKKETLQNRLEKRYNSSKSTKDYQIVKDIVNETNKSYMVWRNEKGQITIRPCQTSGRGRYTTNLDYTAATESTLTLLGIKFESGNDSPRGGKTGNYITIKTKIEF
jgi:hypothetical protein